MALQMKNVRAWKKNNKCGWEKKNYNPWQYVLLAMFSLYQVLCDISYCSCCVGELTERSAKSNSKEKCGKKNKKTNEEKRSTFINTYMKQQQQQKGLTYWLLISSLLNLTHSFKAVKRVSFILKRHYVCKLKFIEIYQFSDTSFLPGVFVYTNCMNLFLRTRHEREREQLHG